MRIKKIYEIISAGNPRKLIRPTVCAVISNLLNVIPFCFLGLAVFSIYTFYAGETVNFPVTQLWTLWAGMLAAVVVMFIGQVIAYRAAFRGAYMAAAEGRANLAEHLRKLPLSYFLHKDSGEVGETMMGSFDMIEQAASGILPQLVAAVISPVFAFLGFLFFDWRMALAMFISMPFAFLLIWAVSGWEKKLGQNTYDARVAAGNNTQEYLDGMKVIKAYNLRGENFSRLKNSFISLMKANIKQEGGLGPIYLIAVAIIKAGISLMTVTGIYLLLGGAFSVPVFVVFLLVGNRVFEPLAAAIIRLGEFRFDLLGGKKILELLSEPVMEGAGAPPENRHDITFEHVDFAYEDTDVLKDVSLELKQGELTAIVGPSGSGKSTILRLAARFYDPQKGRIAFGGVDDATLDPEKLMSKISMVFQDVYLFEDTIEANIRYGRENATKEEIITAAKEARCHDFIMKLPNGYDTMVGEGGSTLSGGEKQRLSIARALLKNAPVVFLDEATASLDPENEWEVQQAIGRLVKGRTVVMIAHRLKTVVNADKIIVLEDGRVAQQGTHDELLKSKGLYTHLWELQQQVGGWKITG